MTKLPNQFSSKKIITFLLLTFGLTALFDIPAILFKVSGEANTLHYVASMWSPAIAVFITKWIYKENIGSLNWKWPKTKYILLAFFVPFLYSLISYLIIWTAGWGSFYNVTYVKQVAEWFGTSSYSDFWTISIFVFMSAIFGLITSSSKALGEEIGWRGFLVPELLKKFGYVKTSLLSGSIWALYHYTNLIFGEYNNGTPFLYGMICFTVMIISISFIFTWYTIKSGSLFPAMILHASHNQLIQGIFTPLTSTNEKSPWFIDEFGVVLAIVTLIFAFYFISRRKELIVQCRI